MAYGHTLGRNPDRTELRQCWRTPKELFDQLHSIFHFTIDACASEENALLPRYWTEKEDALKQDWTQEVVFCNPPFGLTTKILEKAGSAWLACVLVPATTLTTRSFHANPPTVLVVPPKRIAFDPPVGMGARANPAMGTLLAVYYPTKEQKVQLAAVGEVYNLSK